MRTVKVVDEYEFVIVGSGFGGAVSALRLAEKGYKVAVLEAGKRFQRASRHSVLPSDRQGIMRSVPQSKLFNEIVVVGQMHIPEDGAPEPVDDCPDFRRAPALRAAISRRREHKPPAAKSSCAA
jgi:choline dehydrogenase-like flavoprotein